MSIKSQKSLREECSEIIERSYSVRSYSDDSISCEDEDECLAIELMNKLSPAALSKLRRRFVRTRPPHAGDIDRRVEEVMRQAAAQEGIQFQPSERADGDGDQLALTEEAFVRAVNDVFGHQKYTIHARKLFLLLDPFSSGRVRWRQLLDRLLAVGARRTRSRADVWTPIGEMRMERLEHCKREPIVKLVSIERPESFCYVAVSKGGRVGVYSGLLRLMHSYEVFHHTIGLQRRVRNRWITDCVYLDDVQCLIMSASDRSLTVYDSATLTHTPVYYITGLPNIPTCMSYSPIRHGTSELAIGTERGDIIRIRFLQPRVSLFHCKSSEHVNNYFWMELSSPPHTPYCAITTWRRVHARSVRRVAHERDRDIVASCSHDTAVSVRLRHVAGKIQDYTFKVPRGVTCMHMLPSLRLLAAGGAGGVRLWDSAQPEPYACLATLAPVVDIAIMPGRHCVVAFCSDCTLHFWDIYEECLLQTIKLKFPFLGVLGKKVEFGLHSIHPGPARQRVCADDSSSDQLEPPPGSLSRRSSVLQAPSGGLVLQDEGECVEESQRGDGEHSPFDRPELVISCCEHVCTVQLGAAPRAPRAPLRPPPAHTLRARRPSFWDLPDDVFTESTSALPKSPKSDPSPTPPLETSSLQSKIPSAMLLSPSMAEFPQEDLDTLLENAGLRGILEKDFVLMKGLKHDLNKKLADMKANMSTSMSTAVSMGAPYLGLRCIPPVPLQPPDDMMDQYYRVMRLFPESSLTATPSTSNASTPRNKNSTRLT